MCSWTRQLRHLNPDVPNFILKSRELFVSVYRSIIHSSCVRTFSGNGCMCPVEWTSCWCNCDFWPWFCMNSLWRFSASLLRSKPELMANSNCCFHWPEPLELTIRHEWVHHPAELLLSSVQQFFRLVPIPVDLLKKYENVDSLATIRARFQFDQ